MAKIFLAYRFSGENLEELEPILTKLKNSLEIAGYEVFCTFWLGDFFKKNAFSNDQIYEYGLRKIEECDIFLAFVKSEDLSKGMQRESEKAKQKNKKYILAIQKDLKFPEFRSAANHILEYQDLEQLYPKLQEIKVQS